jgi:hypothetical protein
VAEGLLRKDLAAKERLRGNLPRLAPRLRIATAHALAGAGVRGMAPVVAGALEEEGRSAPAWVEAVRALVAAVRGGDPDALAPLQRELRAAESAGATDRRHHGHLVEAVHALTTLESLPPSLEAWLTALWDAPSTDVGLRTSIAAGLGVAGSPAAAELLRPHGEYGRPPSVREFARQAIGHLERRHG